MYGKNNPTTQLTMDKVCESCTTGKILYVVISVLMKGY